MTLLSSVQKWWFGRDSARAFHQLSDVELLHSFAHSGDRVVLEALINRHCDALYHFILSLSDAVLAEDISQQIWLKLIEKPDRFQSGTAQFRTWLFSSAHNAVIDELRRLNRWQWQTLDEVEQTHDYSDTEQDVHFKIEMQHQFDLALMALPFPQREALMLQLEGFSLAEISHITMEKQETIKSRLRFARKTLTQALEVSV